MPERQAVIGLILNSTDCSQGHCTVKNQNISQYDMAENSDAVYFCFRIALTAAEPAIRSDLAVHKMFTIKYHKNSIAKTYISKKQEL